MCDCNSKKDPKLSKNDKAKQTITCKPTKFVLTFNGKYNDGSRKSVSVIFKSTPVNPTCDYPSQSDYDKAVNNLLLRWNGEQLKLAKKYKAAGKAAPKLTKRSTSLVCPSAGASECSSKCDGYCAFKSEDDCNNAYDTTLCIRCADDSDLWIYPLS